MGTNNLFILFLAALLICCSSNTSQVKPSTPVEENTPIVLIPPPIEESANQLESSVGAAQSVIDAIHQEQVEWHEFSFERMVGVALSGTFVLVYFYSDYCDACDKTEKEIYNNEYIVEMLNKHFYAMRVNVNKHPELAPIYADERSGSVVTPTVMFVMPTGMAMKILGYIKPGDFATLIKQLVSIKEGWISVRR